jgi:hypothetical protein
MDSLVDICKIIYSYSGSADLLFDDDAEHELTPAEMKWTLERHPAGSSYPSQRTPTLP